MELETIALVKETMDLVTPTANETARLFYQRLFELDPTLEALFEIDIKAQQVKFMDTLTFIVSSLDMPDLFLDEVKALGRRHHMKYGVLDAHYPTVFEALSWALAQSLADDFTPEAEAAWREAYYLIAGLMKEAAQPDQ